MGGITVMKCKRNLKKCKIEKKANNKTVQVKKERKEEKDDVLLSHYNNLIIKNRNLFD